MNLKVFFDIESNKVFLGDVLIRTSRENSMYIDQKSSISSYMFSSVNNVCLLFFFYIPQL